MSEQWPILVGTICHPGRSHEWWQVCATGDPLPCGRYTLAPLNGNFEGSMGLVVPRVGHTQPPFPTNILYKPGGQHTLAFLAKFVIPEGQAAAV